MQPQHAAIPRRRLKAPVAAIAIAALIITAISLFAPNATAARAESTIWGDAKPAGVTLDTDTQAVTLGTRFTPTVDGDATGVRFYKVEGMSGTHVGVLWNARGQRLGTVTFSNETASGWQSADFSKAIALKAGESYVVAYQVPRGGRYAATENHRGGSLDDAFRVSTSNSGVYTYASRAMAPRSTWRSSQYWVDVTFLPSNDSNAAPNPSSTATATPTPRPTTTTAPRPTPTPTATTPTPTPTATTAPSPTPTPTTTPPATTPPPAQAGKFPTGSTAGLPAGWQPKQTVTGDYWIRTAGAVVEDLRISNGTIYVAAQNVTLRRIEGTNVRVFNTSGSGCVGRGMVVEDSTFLGARADDGQSVIGDGGYTVRNVKIDGAPEGLRVGYASQCGGVTVEKTFIRIVPPAQCGDWHGDGIQGYTGGHLVVRDSTIEFNERNGCYGTAAFFYPAGQGNTSVDINGLLVSGGGYPFRLGMPGSVTNLNVVNNSWGYGPIEVGCGLLSSWQASVVQLDASGQPTPVRSLTCGR